MTGTVPLAQRARRAALAVAFLALLGALLATVGLPCAFARLTGLPCPSCGSTRAVRALLVGDLHGVLHYNPLGPIIAVILGGLALSSLRSLLLHGDFRDAGSGRHGRALRIAAYVTAALSVVLWGARFFGFLGGPVPV